MNILPDLTAIRGRVYCGRCGGAFYSLGPESRWVPHQPGCPRGPKNVAGADANSRSTGAVRHDGELPQHRPLNVAEGGVDGPTGDASSRSDLRSAPPRATQSTAQQDQEREALAELTTPFVTTTLTTGDVDDWPRYGPIRWPDGPSALSGMVRQKPSWRRQSVAPNYGQDGP